MVSDDQQTLVQIGKCYADLGRFKDAEAVLRRAVALADDAVGSTISGTCWSSSDGRPKPNGSTSGRSS